MNLTMAPADARSLPAARGKCSSEANLRAVRAECVELRAGGSREGPEPSEETLSQTPGSSNRSHHP